MFTSESCFPLAWLTWRCLCIVCCIIIFVTYLTIFPFSLPSLLFFYCLFIVFIISIIICVRVVPAVSLVSNLIALMWLEYNGWFFQAFGWSWLSAGNHCRRILTIFSGLWRDLTLDWMWDAWRGETSLMSGGVVWFLFFIFWQTLLRLLRLSTYTLKDYTQKSQSQSDGVVFWFL